LAYRQANSGAEERREERGELSSHTSNKLDTGAYAMVGPNRITYEED